jgi:arylsulfatase A-like enzyme
VFIFSDRQRYDTMRCYGNDWIQTPNLNALADESIVFENTYVTQAVCAPARSSIMTGLYPHSAGVPTNRRIMSRDVPTVAEMVSDEYLCGYYGKWHLGDEMVRQHGFQEWLPAMDSMWNDYSDAKDFELRTPYHDYLVEHGYKPDKELPHGGRIFSDGFRAGLPAEYQMASFLAERAADFIQRHKERPFVLYVSFLEPHPPFTGPFNHLYDPSTLPVDPSFMKKPDGASLFNRVRADFFSSSVVEDHDLRTEAGWRTLRSNYYGNVSIVDGAVGRIVDAVDSAGLRDNTAVVFTSEHGDLVGSHAMLEMRTFYEAACKVPMMIRAPWVSDTPRMIGGNLGQIDLLPTMLDLLDEPIPDHLQGVSRKEVLSGVATLENNSVFMEHNGIGDRDLTSAARETDFTTEQRENLNWLNRVPWRSVVTPDRWKLNLSPGDQCELFDLKSDPYELTNLFDEPEHRDRIRYMAARIRTWQHETDDSAPLPSL